MNRKASAAALLLATPLLLGQAPNAPPKAPAPNIRPAAPPATPTPPSALLHLDGSVTNLGCGKPLEFDITVKNVAGVPFAGGADLHVAGPALNHPPYLEGLVRVPVPALAAGATQAMHVTAPPVKVDCAAVQTFVATLTPGANLLTPHPQWDRDALELSTTPPTNCSATQGSRRLPHWDPRM